MGATREPGTDAGEAEDFFDPEFLSELEHLTEGARALAAPSALEAGLDDKLRLFLAPIPGQDQLLDEHQFAALPSQSLAERTNGLLEICRQGGRREAVQSVENFVVFFQALVPTLSDEGSREIKRVFFRLAPTLIQIAYKDFSESEDERRAGPAALHSLESILIEISSVRLAPSESELVFRAIDQISGFIAVGEYTLAHGVISSQLLSIISRNKLTRALYRLMEVEVALQVYLKQKRGYPTPQVRLPEDYAHLAEYGPIQLLQEESLDGSRRRLIQVHLPDIPILRDIVLHLAPADGSAGWDLRLDALGSAELRVPDGTYQIGLVYQPEQG